MVESSTILRVTARFDDQAIDAVADGQEFMFTPADEVLRIAPVAGRIETRTFPSLTRDGVHAVIRQVVESIDVSAGQPRFSIAPSQAAESSVSRPAREVWIGPSDAHGWSWQLMARDAAGQMGPLLQTVLIGGTVHEVSWWLSVELL